MRTRALILAAVVLGLWSVPMRGAHAARAKLPTLVGVAAVGDTAYEYAAQGEQTDAGARTVGILTNLTGLPQAPFAGSATSEATALFTVVSTVTVSQRVINATMRVVNYGGELRVYFHDPSTISATNPLTYTNPLGFAQGTLVARMAERGQDILTVLAPNQGVINGTAVTQQIVANSFTLGGHTYQFGRVGARNRTVYTGFGQRLSIKPIHDVLVLAGYSTVLP
jgi:hypothetical protein